MLVSSESKGEGNAAGKGKAQFEGPKVVRRTHLTGKLQMDQLTLWFH